MASVSKDELDWLEFVLREEAWVDTSTKITDGGQWGTNR